MKLYYIEYNQSDASYPDIMAHYIEVTELGTLIEYNVVVDDDDMRDSTNTTYESWGEYFATYRDGKEDFYKRGHKVRVL